MSEPNQETVRIAPALAPGNISSAVSPLLRLPLKPPAPGPRNETARVAIQPGASSAPAGIAFDSIPRSYFWAIFGLAALIFLIQIWNYVVS